MTTPPDTPDTISLNTKVEEDFVSPLTAVRGTLELLRDHPELDRSRRRDFIERALHECERLQRGVDQLAASIYEAAHRGESAAAAAPGAYAERISHLQGEDVVEIDLSDFLFPNSQTVNEFFDNVEATLEPAGKRWFFLINYRNCRVWPEAWIAFAHRGRRLSERHARGSVRYDDSIETGAGTVLPSRAEALARIRQMASDV